MRDAFFCHFRILLTDMRRGGYYLSWVYPDTPAFAIWNCGQYLFLRLSYIYNAGFVCNLATG